MSTFFGVGVGPGDPSLLTLRAVRILEKVTVLAVPRTKGENTLALDIVRGEVDLEGKRIVYLDFPMVSDPSRRDAAHRRNLSLLLGELEKGDDVAMLTLGDASTFSNLNYYLPGIRKAGYGSQIIPGVNSYCAGAAKLQISLTRADLPLHIVPTGVDRLNEILALPGSKVLMKPVIPLKELQGALDEAGVLQETLFIERAGLPSEVSGRLCEREEELAYFTTLFIPGEEK